MLSQWVRPMATNKVQLCSARCLRQPGCEGGGDLCSCVTLRELCLLRYSRENSRVASLDVGCLEDVMSREQL